MAITNSHPQVAKKAGPSKLVVGFLAAAMTAFVGLAGVANASPGNGNGGNGQNVGYGGYGTQTTINADIKTDIDLKVNGSNNVFNIVINYIIGGS